MKKEEITKLFKYFKGEEDSPYEVGTPNAKFWHGEKMFLHTQQPIEEWANEAKRVRASLDDERRKTAEKYSDEQFGIILYIEDLFAKWCPMESRDFIFSY